MNFEEQTKLNLKHRGDPQAGDYWHERGSIPIFLVIAVGPFGVIVFEKMKDTWAWNVGEPLVLSFSNFSKRITYSTIPQKTWCDVVPNSKDWEVFAKRAFGK